MVKNHSKIIFYLSVKHQNQENEHQNIYISSNSSEFNNFVADKSMYDI